jgi:hypothetical protein
VRTFLGIALVPCGLAGTFALAGPEAAVALLLSLTAVAFVVYVASYAFSLHAEAAPQAQDAAPPAPLRRRAASRLLAGATRTARVPVSPTL